PELEMKDVALTRKQVVTDIDPAHRSKVVAHDRHRNKLCHARRVVITLFDFLQGLAAKMVLRILGFVKRSDASINIPAEVVEFDRLIGHHAPDVFQTFALDMFQANNDIGNLHTRVVDVILNFDCPSGRLQNAYERIADGGVPEMAD